MGISIFNFKVAKPKKKPLLFVAVLLVSFLSLNMVLQKTYPLLAKKKVTSSDVFSGKAKKSGNQLVFIDVA